LLQQLLLKMFDPQVKDDDHFDHFHLHLLLDH